MPAQYKVLGQQTPLSNTMTTLYTVPASTNTIVSTLNICNPNYLVNVAVSIAVIPNGRTLASNSYLVYSLPVPYWDTISLTLGLTLSSNDVIQVYANGQGNVAFSAFGTEIT